MSKKIRIDELFQEQLVDYVSPTPTELWASIETQLIEEPIVGKERPFWLLFSLFLLVSVVGLGAYWASYMPTETPVAKRTLPVSIAATNTSLVDGSNSETANDSGKKSFQNELKKNKKNNSVQATKSKDKVSTIVKTPISASKDTKLIGSSVAFAAKKQSQAIKNDISQADNVTFNTNKRKTKNNFNLTPVSEERQESSATTEDQRLGESNSENFTFDSSSLNRNTPQSPVVSLFSTLTFPDFKTPDPTGLKCPSGFKIMPKPRFYIDGLLGFDYARRIITARNDGSHGYVGIRNETENYASAYSFGARFSVIYKTGFVWRIGLVYNRLNEKINLVDLEGYDHIENAAILEQDNVYQFVDVPLLFGYEFNDGRLTWGFNAGAYFNLAFKSPTNYILGADKEQIVLSDLNTINETPVFKGQIGLSFYTSVAATCYLTDKVSLIIEPNIRFMPNSLTVDSYELEQRYLNIGLLSGLRFKF